MINWGQIISQAIPLIIFLFIAAAISGILSEKKTKKRQKNINIILITIKKKKII